MLKQNIFKKTWLISFALLLLLSGCGGGGGGSDSGTSGGGTAGVAVDPYIIGAVFEEVSSSGEILQTSSESDATGKFRFPKPVNEDSIIRIKEGQKGIHIGKPYDGFLQGTMDDAGSLVVSPLTTLMANGFTAEQIVIMLDEAGISLQESDLYDDPMEGLNGLETFTDGDLALLQASIAVNDFLLRLDNFSWGPGDDGDLAYLRESVDMVKSCLSWSRYQEIRNQLSSTLTDWDDSLTVDYLISATSNLVETVTVAVRNGQTSDPMGEIAQLSDSLSELTLHYYVRDNRGDTAIEEAITYEILPDISGNQYPQADLDGVVNIYNEDGSVATSDGDTTPDSGSTIDPQPGTYPAPVLESVEVDGSNFVLSWSLPSNPYGDPSGGYDIVIDGVDTAAQWRTDQNSVVINGLEAGVNHSFKIEARWLQAEPYVYPRSNELSGMIPADAGAGTDPVVEDPVTDPDPVDPSSPPASGSLKVFPGAEGYGVDTPAGRGGKIIHVTNLNDSGTGSFRAAVEASGPRIVVFDVSGTIELQKDIKISNPYITIAGQTAPAPGIQLKNQTVQVSTHDVLMQHLALRPGDTFVSGSGGEVHALIVTSSAYNCVFDHLSLYWGIDECVGVYGDDLTFSNNIIAEGLDDSLHPDGAHSCGMLIMAGAQRVAVVRNLYANHNHRSPWIKENTTVYHANNYAYNSRGTFFNYTTDRSPYTGSLISVSNVYGKGPSSDTTKGLSVSSNFTSADVYEADSRGDSASPYGVLSTLVKCASEYRVDYHPFDAPAYNRLDSGSVKNHIIANAGSRPGMRDSADARVINQLINFTGSLIDSPSQVGGWPHYASTQRVFNVGSNPHGDDDGDGYTNIEEILHQMSADVEG